MRTTSRHSPGGGLKRREVSAEGDRDEDLAAAGERADVLAGLERLVAAGERGGTARAQRERPPDQVELRRRLGRRERRAPQLPVDRPAVVRVDEREERQLVALVDVGDAR